MQHEGHELEPLPRSRYAVDGIHSKLPLHFTLRNTLSRPPPPKLLLLFLVHPAKNGRPQKLFRIVDRGHLARHSELHEMDKQVVKGEPLGDGTGHKVIAPGHVLCIIFVVVEGGDRPHEQHTDDASPVRKLVIGSPVQYLGWRRAERSTSNVELDISPAFRVEVVQEGSHVAGETVNVRRGWGRRRGIPPAGERGADIVNVLGRDGTRGAGRLSDREGAMEIKENGRAGSVA